jgi:hypothetical protein
MAVFLSPEKPALVGLFGAVVTVVTVGRPVQPVSATIYGSMHAGA